MCVIVSLKITLDATATLSHLERQIEEAGRAAMKAALKQAIRAAEAQQSSCPGCGSDQFHTQGTKRRVLLTRFGRVDVPLKRLRCHACRRLFRPAERCLAEVKGHNVTPSLRDLAALVGSSWPYATAAGVLKGLSEVQLSDERLRQITNEQGQAVAQAQSEQAQQVLKEAVSMEHIRTQRAQSTHTSKQSPPEWLQVGLDGGWLPSREQKGGMEGKIGVVASQMKPVGKHGRHRLSRRRYVATFGPAEVLGRLTYAAACDLGATEAARQVVVGDGADWIKTQANEHFPDAVKVLDWSHLWRKVQAAVRALLPGQRADRRAWRKAQYELLLPLLWQGEREQALRHLHRLRPTSGDVPASLEEAIRYLETQADWIGNYQRWQEQGYPVGSGLVERAVAIVINVRMKKRGMRWKRANATAVVALRVQQINIDWAAAAA
jgi:transposase